MAGAVCGGDRSRRRLVARVAAICRAAAREAHRRWAGQEGRNHMLWGIVGLVIMVSAFAIMQMMAGILGPKITP